MNKDIKLEKRQKPSQGGNSVFCVCRGVGGSKFWLQTRSQELGLLEREEASEIVGVCGEHHNCTAESYIKSPFPTSEQ